MNLQQLIKYFLEGLGVALATYLVKGQTISLTEVVTIGLASAVSFFILDLFAPSVAMSSRQGSGFGIGAQTVGAGIEGFVQMDKRGTVTYFDSQEGSGCGIPAPPALSEEGGEAEAEGEGEGEGDVRVEGDYTYTSGIFPNKNCHCGISCTGMCQPENKCKITCPPQPPCFKEGCDIRGTNCPYKIIPGYYSQRVLLSGYNECVKPYNSEYINQVDI